MCSCVHNLGGFHSTARHDENLLYILLGGGRDYLETHTFRSLPADEGFGTIHVGLLLEDVTWGLPKV